VFNCEASVARKEYLSLYVNWHRGNIDIIDIRHSVDILDYISATVVAEIFIKLKERLTLYLNKKNRTIYLQLYINS